MKQYKTAHNFDAFVFYALNHAGGVRTYRGVVVWRDGDMILEMTWEESGRSTGLNESPAYDIPDFRKKQLTVIPGLDVFYRLAVYHFKGDHCYRESTMFFPSKEECISFHAMDGKELIPDEWEECEMPKL